MALLLIVLAILKSFDVLSILHKSHIRESLVHGHLLLRLHFCHLQDAELLQVYSVLVGNATVVEMPW